MLSEKILRFARASWQGREPLIAARLPGLLAAREGLAGDKRTLFEYVAGTLPLTDLGDYAPALFLAAVEHGLRVREEFPWCGALPETLFLKDVLCPRVNNEALSECRALFYEELAPRVQGMPLSEAILEVNRWCGENVRYRSTDGTTSSALDIYRRGWGRCGEESAFAVNALRSVGIAARQVYAPRWSHCDDNHAWVEAWDGADWRFLGACEPEPRLDMGWFTRAAGRAMLCHTKAFVGEGGGWRELFPDESPLDLDRREGVAYESVTARYARVRPFTVTVTGPDSLPAAGAVLEFSILNEGALCPIARRITDTQGKAELNLGLGSLVVTARKGEDFAEALINTAETDVLALSLPGEAIESEFFFVAPADGDVEPPVLDAGEKKSRREVLARAKALREGRETAAPEVGPRYREIAGTLTEKDRAAEIPAGVLEECLGLERPEGMPKEVFRQAVLCPRVGLEPLAPWRQVLAGAVDAARPEELWARLKEEFAPAESFPELPQTPVGAWRLGRVGAEGLATLFCALCRARGVPARPGVDGLPEFWRDGGFHRADGLPGGTVTVRVKPGESGGWSLMRLEDGWRQVQVTAGEGLELPEGLYRLVTAARLPDGNQRGRFRDFRLAAGENRVLDAGFPPVDKAGFSQRLRLPELGFPWRGPALLCWIQPGEEPTEHLLGELRQVWDELKAQGCEVYMSAQEGGQEAVPAGSVACPWDEDVAEAVARRMYLEPGRLPLVVLADAEGYGRCAWAGYRVGAQQAVFRRVAALTALPE